MRLRLAPLALTAIGCTAGPSLAGTANVDVTAAEVWALPDMDPYQSSFGDWFNGNAVGQWTDGIPSIGNTSPFVGDIQDFDTFETYLGLGSDIVETNGGTFGDGATSHQLISGGSVDFTVMSGDVPTTFDNAIALNRTAPDFFAPLNILGFSFSGTDAAFFALDPNDFPESMDGESTAFSLDFSGTQARDYSAILNLETDTPGLNITFNITGTVQSSDTGTGIPTPTAFAAGALLLISTLRRRRPMPPA